MADQNITALPVSTTPASSDQLLLVGATEEKLIDYDKLADAILQKLTSKQYTLDQGTKTLPAALNELNSKLLTAEIHDTDIEEYFKKFGSDKYGLLYFSYNNTNLPVIGDTKWSYFTAVIIRTRVVAFSPSGKPESPIITRQFIDTSWGGWTQIK